MSRGVGHHTTTDAGSFMVVIGRGGPVQWAYMEDGATIQFGPPPMYRSLDGATGSMWDSASATMDGCRSALAITSARGGAMG